MVMRTGGPLEGRRDIEDFLTRVFGSGDEKRWPAGGFQVPTDVFHADDKLVIRMDLPEVKADDVEVTVQENVLLINGTRHFPYDPDKVRFVSRGTFYGDFTQRVALGRGLDTEKITARYENGVLELSIAYAEEIQPKKIQIEVGDRQALKG